MTLELNIKTATKYAILAFIVFIGFFGIFILLIWVGEWKFPDFVNYVTLLRICLFLALIGFVIGLFQKKKRGDSIWFWN